MLLEPPGHLCAQDPGGGSEFNNHCCAYPSMFFVLCALTDLNGLEKKFSSFITLFQDV